jgi:D-alanyl-D-alanine carboxypeptidase
VVNARNGKIIAGKNENEKREVASLTKVMTAHIVCNLISQMKIDPKHTFCEVSELSNS